MQITRGRRDHEVAAIHHEEMIGLEIEVQLRPVEPRELDVSRELRVPTVVPGADAHLVDRQRSAGECERGVDVVIRDARRGHVPAPSHHGEPAVESRCVDRPVDGDVAVQTATELLDRGHHRTEQG